MNCKYCRANCTGAKHDRKIALCLGYDPPKTNGDFIRSMSDEKLAEVLINLPNHLGCYDPNDGCMMDFSEDKLCSECVLKWLRQECE